MSVTRTSCVIIYQYALRRKANQEASKWRENQVRLSNSLDTERPD